MLGLQAPGDERIPVSVREWNGMKLALWRSRVGWEYATREALDILSRCAHANGCPGENDETRQCLPDRWEKASQGEGETDEEFLARPGIRVASGCPDRELRMNALVILNNARTLAPVDARRAAADPYTPPSREYFSEVMATLGAAQMENDALREALRAAGVEVPEPVAHTPSMLTERAPPPQLSPENPQ